MKRFADSIARQNGVKPPPNYTTSGSICRAFLDQHAPKKACCENDASGAKPVSPAQMSFAERLAHEEGIVVPAEAKANSSAMAAWIDANQVKKSRKSRKKPADAQTKSIAPKSSASKNRFRKLEGNVTGRTQSPTAAREKSQIDTPLQIPYGNKDVALKLGARYRSGQWYAPPGVKLTPFKENGWLAARRVTAHYKRV